MRTNVVRLSVATLALATGACAHHAEMAYESSPGAEQQEPVSSYGIPRNAPKGGLYVMSFGGERLATQAGAPEFFLHVRLAAENTGDSAAWTINPNEQVAHYDGAQNVPASFAQASEGGPVLTVAPGKRAYIDLYYPLPPTADPPHVSLSWQLHRGDEVVADTSGFERVTGRDSEDYVYYRPYGPNLYVGLGWWWGPWGYPWGVGWGWGGGYGRGYGGYGYGRPYYGGYGHGYVRGGYGGGVRGGGYGGGVRSAPSGGRPGGGYSGGHSAPSGGGHHGGGRR